MTLEVAQTYTDGLKAAAADGTFTAHERAHAKAMALSKLKSNLGKRGPDRIERILGIESIDGWLATRVEAAVKDASTAPTSAARSPGVAVAAALGAPLDPARA